MYTTGYAPVAMHSDVYRGKSCHQVATYRAYLKWRFIEGRRGGIEVTYGEVL